MRRAFGVAEIRAAEQQLMAVLPEGTLMQRAAAGLATVLAGELRTSVGGVYGSRLLVLAGSGDNGGDALYAAARLARRGVRVSVWQAGERVHRGGLGALLAAGGTLVDSAGARASLGDREVDLVVDGLLGIGGRSGLEGAAAEVAALLRQLKVAVVAVDLPSGLDADGTSVPEHAIRATRTVTFGAFKTCHLAEPARSACGRVDLVDIGLELSEARLVGWEAADLASVWPRPTPLSDKYARGVVGIDAGSTQYPGAGLLAAFGAVHAGAGMVRFLGSAEATAIVIGQLPNVVGSPGRVQAHLLGPGWGERADGHRVVADALASSEPVLVDADGLRYLPDRVTGECLLTPHAGELARLIETDRTVVESDPISSVRRAVDRYRATVLLKGSTQYALAPGQRTVQTAVPGPAWTAQAGSGDVLSGICATLLAAGLRPVDAALCGASIQALTAADHQGPLPPHELARALRSTLIGRGIIS